MMIFSLVAMIGLEKCCITSACLQWLCHSGERTVARGPLVFLCFFCYFHISSPLGDRVVIKVKFAFLCICMTMQNARFDVSLNKNSKQTDKLTKTCFFFLTPHHFQSMGVRGGRVVGGGYSITAVHPSVLSVPSVHDKNGFRSISFEQISVLDSNFIRSYIIVKCRSSSI